MRVFITYKFSNRSTDGISERSADDGADGSTDGASNRCAIRLPKRRTDSATDRCTDGRSHGVPDAAFLH